MKLAIASLLVLGCVALVGTGWLALRGLASATAWALEVARPVVEAVPVAQVPEQIRDRLDDAVVALREGRVDGGAVRETLLWLPVSLLDGQLDAGEVAELGSKLDRILATSGASPRDGEAAPPG